LNLSDIINIVEIDEIIQRSENIGDPITLSAFCCSNGADVAIVCSVAA
jgi:hypothetical protein